MGENNLKIRIKHRYDTEANWNKNNPVLLSGEVAISSDKSGKHKVGDGTHKWSELSYAKAELTKGDVTGALGYTPPAKDTWRGIQNNLISTATDQSLSAAQGKWLNENKATITTLTNGNLDKVTTPGFYNAGGGNSVTNKPSGVDNFGMIVVHSASGNYYTQIVYVDDKSYRRVCRNGTWGNWSQDILTDTKYTHPGYTAKSSGLYKITVDGTGHVSATTAVTKSDITALGIPGQDTNTTYSTGTSSTPGLAKLYTGTGSATDGTMTQKAITDGLNSKSGIGHTHNYAGSGSAGGSANSAVKLDTTTAGSATQPVYFSGGKPVACSYTLGKSVPADALFTDHTYGNMKGATSSAAGSAGLVPAPNIGEQLKFLRADGAWVIPTNTTYSVGTSSYLGITKLYTETGSATDGTMTQNAITTALNGKSATGHTHNYAGSSSAGGNANAAVKLATARKIGSASFDGTADITLSQMGLNVPVEITKADYLAKKKAGTLNANTYYNVIDEYDSANVINDSSVTANSAFSSTKSEKTYAKKSTLVTTTLTASKWTGSSAPYTYVLPVSGATTSNIVEINYASNASSQAIEAYQNAMLADGGQTTNQITIKATEKPTVDIPITIVIRNDL